jgi:hypothetical protein
MAGWTADTHAQRWLCAPSSASYYRAISEALADLQKGSVVVTLVACEQWLSLEPH